MVKSFGLHVSANVLSISEHSLWSKVAGVVLVRELHFHDWGSCACPARGWWEIALVRKRKDVSCPADQGMLRLSWQRLQA